MTFAELAKVIRMRWWLLVAIPVLFAVVTVLILVVRAPVFSASAQLTVSGEVAPIGAMAESAVVERSSIDPEASVTTTATSKTIVINVKGTDGDAAVKLANELAATTKAKVAVVYADKVAVDIRNADSAANVSPSKKHFAALAFLAGLIIAFLAIIVEDGVRKPLRRVREIEEQSGIACVGPIATDGDYCLLAQSPLFSLGGEDDCVYALPVRDEDAATEFAKRCSAAGLSCVKPCAILASEPTIVSTIRGGKAVVVIQEWADKQANLDDCLSRMSIAGLRPELLVLIGS